MSEEPLVSFVVPCYNYARYLPDCLNSIFAQVGYHDIEVIAIDDCSADDTVAILRTWRDPRLVVRYHSVNQGHVATMNEGLSIARGRFIARIDPDDRYRPNFLATLLPEFNRSDRIGFAYGDAAVIDTNGIVTASCSPQPHGAKPFAGWALIDVLTKNYICAPAAIGLRTAWQKYLPIWDGLAFNDFYFNALIARDFDFAYVPTVVADYRVHRNNHHSQITLNRTEEPSLMRVLDWVFANLESDPHCEQLKQAARKRIYAAHYFELADKYFGVGYYADARRCYLRAFELNPLNILRSGPLRRFIGTIIGRRSYERAKSLLTLSRQKECS